MHERVQLCQDPHTEFAILRECRINQILTILEEPEAAKIFDEVGQRSLQRLFPGFTEDSLEQATLSSGQSGVGYKRAWNVAGPAHLGSLIAATTRIVDLIRHH